MRPLNKNKVGMAVGAMFALLHAVWALLVVLNLGQLFLNWILHLHFMEWQYTITDFSWLTAVWLIIVTAIIGYIVGWVLAWIWNWVHRESHMS